MINELLFDEHFPTVVGVVDCPFFNEVKDEYRKYLNIVDNETPKGFVYHQLHEDKRFSRLNDWTLTQVNKFSQAHKIRSEIKAKESWFIDYKLGDFQPYHKHSGWLWTSVFFFESNENNSPLKIKSPLYYTNMNREVAPHKSEDAEHHNRYSYMTYSYNPVPGRLIICNANLEHMVDPPKSNMGRRIVFAYNYDTDWEKRIV